MRIHRTLMAASVAAMALPAMPANAVSFVLNDTGGAAEGTQARKGFDIATAYWASVFSDDITVNLNIGFKSLGGDILGSTGSSRRAVLTSDVYDALNADRTSALDKEAVSSLKGLTTVNTGANAGLRQLAATVNQGSTQVPGAYSDNATRLDNDGSNNNIALAVNTANLKALGYTGLGGADGSITFSSDFAFDFDPTDGITAEQSDFIGVAIHEIGHALGFVSGVDSYDYYTYNIAGGGPNVQGILDNYAVSSALDLFRYSAAGNVDWSTSDADKYFSIDGGATKFNGNASFAAGVYNGDGDQASHWKAPTASPFCSGLVGVMNPYLCSGTGAIITADDLAAFDAMGWDVNLDVLANKGYTYTTAQAYTAFGAGAVPEPATWAMMIAGFGMIGGLSRRRSSDRRITLTA